MNLISRLEQIWEQDKGYAARYAIVFSGSVFVHTLLAMMFAIAGMNTFAILNAVSVLGCLIWLELFSRKPMNETMLIAPYWDVLLHSCIYNMALGPAPAFFLYNLTIIPLSYLLSMREGKSKHPVMVSTIMAITSMMLVLASLSGEPTSPLRDPAMTRHFFQTNLILCAMLLGLYTWEFLTETRFKQAVLSHHAEYDPLTGLRNRFNLEKIIGTLQGSQYCIIMCDIDDFKRINDSYGHSVGDVLLSRIGKTIQSCLQREDVACRWGGEEFLLVIRSDLGAARTAADRIRRRMKTITEDAAQLPAAVTMTFGIADCLEAETFEKVAAIADKNLLQGKRMGKNCVIETGTDLSPLIPAPPSVTLDTSNLTSAVFAAFAATSDTTYVYICNLSTNVSRWSQTAVDYFGLPSEYMYDAGNVWLGFVHPDDRAVYAADINAVLSGRKRTHNVTYRARNKRGEYVICACKGVVTEGDERNPAMFAGTMTNLGLADSSFTDGREYAV